MSTDWYVNAQIVLKDTVLRNAYIGIENGKISEIGSGSPNLHDERQTVKDLQGKWLLPGFIDVHVHGGSDPLLLKDVFDKPADDGFHRAASYIDGVASVLIGISGNISLRTGCPVELDNLVHF